MRVVRLLAFRKSLSTRQALRRSGIVSRKTNRFHRLQLQRDKVRNPDILHRTRYDQSDTKVATSIRCCALFRVNVSFRFRESMMFCLVEITASAVILRALSTLSTVK